MERKYIIEYYGGRYSLLVKVEFGGCGFWQTCSPLYYHLGNLYRYAKKHNIENILNKNRF